MADDGSKLQSSEYEIQADQEDNVAVIQELLDCFKTVSYTHLKREHVDRLPGVKLPDSIEIEDDLEKACTGQDIICLLYTSRCV